MGLQCLNPALLLWVPVNSVVSTSGLRMLTCESDVTSCCICPEKKLYAHLSNWCLMYRLSFRSGTRLSSPRGLCWGHVLPLFKRPNQRVVHYRNLSLTSAVRHVDPWNLRQTGNPGCWQPHRKEVLQVVNGSTEKNCSKVLTSQETQSVDSRTMKRCSKVLVSLLTAAPSRGAPWFWAVCW